MERLMEKLRKYEIPYVKNCPLSERSSFRIGGCAQLAIFPDGKEALVKTLELLAGGDVPFLTVGNASNLVFPDEGFPGAVVFTTHCRGVVLFHDLIRAEAGTSLRKLAVAACEASLAGLEFAHGIPGTLGGALVMNAGAYGGSMSDVCVSSTYYDLQTGRICDIEGDVHEFGYRSSFYHHHPHCVILEAELRLMSGRIEEIREKMRELEQSPWSFPARGVCSNVPRDILRAS